MEKLKSLLLAILAAVLVVAPFGTTEVKAAEKVKVYIFEAGGCPYCEAEVEYLKDLKGYNETFEIVMMELYVDHVDWKPGADYDLGVKVANLFKSAGFKDASYQGTPFVVISDLYAAATYSEDLETVIDKAYSEGDKDVVACVANGGTECLAGATVNGNSDTLTIIVLVVLVAGVCAVVFFSRKEAANEEVEETEEEVEEEVEEEEKIVEVKPTKKQAPKKEAAKETTKKVTKKYKAKK